MVCVPCIILPVLLAIYVRFIQPFILRFVPEQWKTKFDAFLYPTCPIPKRQKPAVEEQTEDENKDTSDATFSNSENNTVDVTDKKND
uniref:Uncharacterized protein n=1 Tax=Panagrolaimus sp. JU765 TaxID=591449 RepID=A0AC34QKC8_9BILA